MVSINSETDVLASQVENEKAMFASIHRAREGMQNGYACMYDENSCYLLTLVPGCEALERGGLVFIFLLQKSH